jgi:hypothetical protein
MFDRGRIRFLNIHAVKHGAFANTAILPGEDRREFEKLHSGLIEEWAPVGPTEEDAVLSIAKGVWRKRRLQKFLHAEIEIWRSDPEHPLYDHAEGLRNLLNIMEAAPILDLMEAPDAFESVIRLAIESTPSYHATILERMCPREQFKSASAWLQALRMVISGLLRGVERDGEEPDVLLDRSAKVHTPDVVNHELAVDERIDAMIDRAVKRLVQTKAMKQMLVTTSPRGGDNQQPKKVQTASLRDQEEVSTINTARADSARAHLRGKRSRMAVATAAAPKAGRQCPGNSAAGR